MWAFKVKVTAVLFLSDHNTGASHRYAHLLTHKFSCMVMGMPYPVLEHWVINKQAAGSGPLFTGQDVQE